MACASSQARATAFLLFFAVGSTCAPEKKKIAAKPKIDKDALKKYSAGEIAEVGAKLEVEDVFGYDVDEEALGQQ